MKKNEVLQHRKALSNFTPAQVNSLIHQYNIDEDINRKSPFKINPSLSTGIKGPIIKRK